MNSKRKINTKKIALLSVLVALGAIFGLVDRVISNAIFPFVPAARIGISNIVVLIALLNYDFKDTLILVVLKALVVGLLFGSLMTFVIGGSASFFSFIVMYLVYKFFKDKLSIVGVSTLGAITHIVVQLIVIILVYKFGSEVFMYGILLIIMSIVTGVMMGFISLKVNTILSKHFFIEN